jgi:hypothetical protein
VGQGQGEGSEGEEVKVTFANPFVRKLAMVLVSMRPGEWIRRGSFEVPPRGSVDHLRWMVRNGLLAHRPPAELADQPGLDRRGRRMWEYRLTPSGERVREALLEVAGGSNGTGRAAMADRLYREHGTLRAAAAAMGVSKQRVSKLVRRHRRRRR